MQTFGPQEKPLRCSKSLLDKHSGVERVVDPSIRRYGNTRSAVRQQQFGEILVETNYSFVYERFKAELQPTAEPITNVINIFSHYSLREDPASILDV